MTAQPMPRRSTPELLASVREDEAFIRDTEVRKMKTIVAWAGANTVTSPADAATIRDGRVDTGLPLAGDGAPLVSEFALIELCACLGRSTASGREYVGKILETAFRLPDLWDAVKTGRVTAWRALAIADKTRLLPADAAEWVDHHLAPFAASCTWAQIDRLVDEALARFDPEAAEQQRRDAAERRHFDIDTDSVSFDGTVHVDGELDLADGLDLNDAISRRAKELAALGCEESLDVRRSMAAGELARHDHTLDYGSRDPRSATSSTTGSRDGRSATSSTTDDTEVEEGAGGRGRRAAPVTRPSGPSRDPRRPGHKIELHIHLTDAALRGVSTSSTTGEVARLANTQTPISPEQVKQWCGTPGTTVIVRPVLDLAGHDPVDSYEIPNRHRRQIQLRDPHCRFPWCNQKASRCDLDHRIPHDQGGPTCPCNEVPLCRRHHRAKTHRAWRYLTLDPGTYLWTSPLGYQYLVNARGTRDLDKLDHQCPGPER